MLQISNLTMSAGNFSVKNVSFSVPDGCCHVLLGGTGNGKTLILEAIAGLRPIISGEILADGREITKDFPENRFISYVPQDLALFPHLNVEQNILYPKRFKKNRGRSDEEIQEIIKCLQIEDIMHRSILNLSGGEQQRVALARAFASGNPVLLLDEPFSALHFTMKRTLWIMLLDIQKRYNLSILMVTHDLGEAEFLADYVSILHQGRVIQTGTKENVFNNPAHLEVTKITGHYNYFSGEINTIDENHSSVIIENIGKEIILNNTGLIPGEKVIIAIRTNTIEIITAESNISNLTNAILCKIKQIYETSHYKQIILTPAHQPYLAQAEIVLDVYNKTANHEFEAGQPITINLPSNEIFLFKRTEAV